MTADKTMTFEEKAIAFWEKVDRSAGPDACWAWTGAVTAKWGYGCFGTGRGITRGAHKIAWLLTNGDPKGLCVCHRCDNRLCCNPAHLFLGTKQDNNDDKLAKSRHFGKYTVDDVREIRRKAAAGMTDRQLADEYGTVPRYIWGIRTRRAWKSVQ